MKDIFYELIAEAMNGNVLLDGETWPIAFNTRIGDKEYFNDNNLCTLFIKNEEEFFTLLDEYVSLTIQSGRKTGFFVNNKDYYKCKQIIAYLFANATLEDFMNPLDLLRKNIGYLKDDTFAYLNDGIALSVDNIFSDSNLVIKNEQQSIYMETPYKMVISIENDDGSKCVLSEISYGIRDNNGVKECNIYSIMSPGTSKKQIDVAFSKKIFRLLYKLNSGVLENESQEYKDYKNGLSDYYPENISDVSPSQVLSMVAFLTLLQNEGIQKINVESYLPVRYMSRSIAAENAKDEETKKARIERNDAIQRNATDKFIRLFRRIMYHMDELKLFAYPDEKPSLGLELRLEEQQKELNNPILNEISNKLQEFDKNKSR